MTNFWEEQSMDAMIKSYHEQIVTDFGLSEWLHELKCPFCKTQLATTAIRSFGFRTNTRNFGDLFVEFACEDCEKLDTLYFQSEVENFSDFVDFCDKQHPPTSDPLIEADMYKANYNNAVERMAEEIQRYRDLEDPEKEKESK